MTCETKRRLLAVALLLVTVAAYEGVRRCDFLYYDDDLFVHRTPIVRQGLTWKGVRWAFKADLFYDSHLADYWAPVTVLSRMLDVSLFGLQPAGHHLTNLFLHCFNAMLVFLVFHGLTGATWRSVFVAAILAVHPLHVESVAWVSERKDMLSCTFWMLTIGAHGAYAKSPSRWRMSVVAAVLALGLMAKPMLVTLPFVLLLLDLWPLGRWNLGRRLIWEKWPLFLLAAASVTISLLPNLGTKTLDALPLGWRVANALDSYVTYLQQAAWPTRLALGYPHSEGSLPVSRLVVCVIVLSLISAVAFAGRARRPYVLVGWFWFVGALVPVIGLVQSGSQARADRYTYIPLIGISVAVAWLAAEWAARWRRGSAAMALLGTMAILSLAALTRRQVSHWRNDLALFGHSVAVLPRSAIAHNGLAAALARKGDLDRAESELREALRIKPDLMFVRMSLSSLLARQGRAAEGALLLEEGLRGVPSSQLQFERGLLRARQGRANEAAEHYAQAIAQNPRHTAALYNWGNLLAAAGRFEEAAAKYAVAARLNPDDEDVANNLGMALLLQGRVEAAIERLSEAVEFDPDNGMLRTSLGRALSAQGRHAEAAAQLREGVRLNPGGSDVHCELGKALQAQGLVIEASTQFREAVRLDPTNAEARSALEALPRDRP